LDNHSIDDGAKSPAFDNNFHSNHLTLLSLAACPPNNSKKGSSFEPHFQILIENCSSFDLVLWQSLNPLPLHQFLFQQSLKSAPCLIISFPEVVISLRYQAKKDSQGEGKQRAKL